MRGLRLKVKALKSYVLSQFLKPPFNKGTIFVTRRCNRKCPYCYTADNERKKELGLQEIRKVIDVFKKMGVWYVAIYGGEPTLRKDLPDIIKYAARDNGMSVILHTNGSFKNVGVAEVVKAGVSIIDVAIDSIANPLLKNYNEVSKILFEILKFNVGVKLNFCVFKENWHEVSAMVELADHFRIPISIHLAEMPILPTNISKISNCELKDMVDMVHVQEISDYLADKARSSILLMHPPEYFESWSRFLRGEEIQWKCRADSSLCVDADGALLQCQNATFPMKLSCKVLNYQDIAENVGLIKQELNKLIRQCNPRCLSCAGMLEYYSSLWRVIKIIFSF